MPSVWEQLRDLVPTRRIRKFCALDFDSRHLRIVQADASGGRVRILKLATADIPDVIDTGDAQAFGEFIGHTLQQMRMRGTAVVMNVPRGQAILKPMTLPPVASTGELASMVQYQAEKELTFKPDEAVFDFTIESHYGTASAEQGEGQGEHVLVAAVQKPVVEYYKKVAQVAQVRLLRLGLRPYANMRCVEMYGGAQAEGRVAVVHITTDETEIDVVNGTGLTFSRSAVVKIPPASDKAAVAEVVRAVVAEVARSLHSYMAVERGQRIDAVLLAGGTGIETDVAAELSRRLAVRCELLNPSEALGLEDQGPAASAFIAALGLAVSQSASLAQPFDFLNPKRPPVERDLTKMLAAGAVAAVVLAVVTAVAGGALRLYSANARVEALTRQLNKLTEENRKVAALAKRVETLEAWRRAGRDWLGQWAYLSAVFPSCTETYVTGLKTNPDGSVNFTVKAKTNEAINELGKRLAAAGYDFRPGQVTTSSDPYGYPYSTSVKVVVKPDMQVDLASASPAPRPEDDASAEKFGRPASGTSSGSASAGGSSAGGSSSSGGPPAANPGEGMSPAERKAAWEARWAAHQKEYAEFYKTRPPDSEAEALQAWRAKREEYRKRAEELSREGEIIRREFFRSQQHGPPQGSKSH